jgi:hypothetical protein
MICLLHGYLLEGSGSNLWTRSIIQSLCQEGYTAHLQSIQKADRFAHILKLSKKIKTDSQGKTAAMTIKLREGLFPGINQSQLMDLIRQNA